MKKAKFIVVYIVVTLLLSCLTFKAVFCADGLEDIKKINNTDTYTEIQFNNVYASKIKCNSDMKEQKSILLSHIYNVKQWLSYVDVSIELISNEDMIKIKNEKHIDSFTGLYIPNDKKMIIVNYDSDTSVHELGHAVYYQVLSRYKKNRVKQLYNDERMKLTDKYGETSDKEFFAVAFSEYIYDSKDLKKYCPKTYEFFENLRNSLK